MLDLIIEKISVGLVTLGITLSGFFGIQNVNQNVGSTYITPDVRALFSTTLASKISSTATEMTLSSATDKNGNTLASSTYGFIIDEGTSIEEFVLADCTGTTCTNMTRGISVSTGTTSVSTARFEHRRGASVKITTAPSLVFAMNVLKGRQNIENVLRYDSSVSTTTIDDDNRNLVNYELLAYTAFNGASVINSSATQKGVVELATQIETASSTVNGSAGVLAIPASNATSTYNAATAPLRVVVTQNNGKIDSNFIATSTLLQNLSLATSTLIGSFNAWDGFFKQKYIITTTGTSTFSVPSGVTKLWVEVQGPGAEGGVANQAGDRGTGGGAGGWSQEIVDVTGTSSIQVYVGAGNGDRTTFGTPATAYLSATGGSSGVDSDTGLVGGIGGEGTGGDLNRNGYNGGSADTLTSGAGANSMYGSGGLPQVTADSTPSTGTIACTGYGSGGAGNAEGDAGNPNAGGSGCQGIIIIRW